MNNAALYILMRDDGFALMERRREWRSWVYPGGKVECGESPEDAAIRECHEEIGVIPEQWVTLPPIDKEGWRLYPVVMLAWSGSPPERTLDQHASLLHWVRPYVVLINNGGTEFTYGAVQDVARALVQHRQSQ